MTSIYFNIVAPSLEINTSPFAYLIILSIPLGPKLVRITSAKAFAAIIFAERTSLLFSDFDKVSPFSNAYANFVLPDSSSDI